MQTEKKINKPRILILEGVDRSGKSTALRLLQKQFESRYTVITMNDCNDMWHQSGLHSHFNTAFKTFDNVLRYDVLSVNMHNTLKQIYMMHQIYTDDKPLLFILNRFALSILSSIYVYRQHSTVWTLQHVDKYVKSVYDAVASHFDAIELIATFDCRDTLDRVFVTDAENDRQNVELNDMYILQDVYKSSAQYNFRHIIELQGGGSTELYERSQRYIAHWLRQNP